MLYFSTICIYFSKVKLQTNIHPYAQRFTLHSLHDCFFAGSIQPEKMMKKFFKVAPQPTRDSGHTPDPLADLPNPVPNMVQDSSHQADSVFTLFSLLFTAKEKALTNFFVSA